MIVKAATPTTRPLTGAAKIAVEKAAKAAKQRRFGQLRAVIIGISISIIAGIAAYVSFDHIRDLCILAGQDMISAHLTPVTVDLMMIVASFQLRRVGITKIARLIARLSMVTGLIASLAANIAAAYLVDPDSNMLVLRLIVSAWPVIPLLAATEMLTHTHKDTPTLIKGKSSKNAVEAKARKASPARKAPEQVLVPVTMN